MKNKIKKVLRESKFILKTYWALKRILIFPLRFTSLWILEPMKIPFKDYFYIKKMSLFLTVKPYTKAGYPRLVNVYDLSSEIEDKNLKGSFIECGTWKGGCLPERFGCPFFDNYWRFHKPVWQIVSGH